MTYIEALAARRTQYVLNRELPVSEADVLDTITEAVRLTPDAFNMRSARAVIAVGEKQDELWNAVYDVFGGKVPKEKIDGFRAAYGTVLYFIDENVVKTMQENVPSYAHNFPVWANQANGMAQFAVWTALRSIGVGANLQHYNPVIDAKAKELLDIPESWTLIAEMPFGGIGAPAADKDGENIADRVVVKR